MSESPEFTHDKIHKNKIHSYNKTCSNDGIIIEYIKATAHELMPLYDAFFNFTLNSGVLPDSWPEVVIWPIYKNKGDSKSPECYRLMINVSCFGKLFTAILNARLNDFIDAHTVFEENRLVSAQAIEHWIIFCIECINRNCKKKNRKKKLFCLFIEFSKAFDSVWRVGL